MYRFSRDGSVKRDWDSTKPAGVQRNVLAVWNEENREELEIIGRAMEEAQNVITTLLDFSKKSGDEGGMASVSTVINQILLLSPKELITKNVRVKLHLEDRCYIQAGGKKALGGEPAKYHYQPIQAVVYDGRIEITCRRRGTALCRSGSRTTAAELKWNRRKERIFEPFLSAKEDGTGIGLWITKRLVTTLSGGIETAGDCTDETGFVIYNTGEGKRQCRRQRSCRLTATRNCCWYTAKFLSSTGLPPWPDPAGRRHWGIWRPEGSSWWCRTLSCRR